MPTPVTDEAPRILSLWQGSWAAALATGVLVWGLILWSVIFHRRSRTKVEVPPQTRYNMPIEALYTVVPIIIVAVLFYFTARDEIEAPRRLARSPTHVVNVVGFQWSWGFNYVENVDGNRDHANGAYRRTWPRSRTDQARTSRPAPSGVYDVGTPGEREPADRQPRPDALAAQGRDGPLRADLA